MTLTSGDITYNPETGELQRIRNGKRVLHIGKNEKLLARFIWSEFIGPVSSDVIVFPLNGNSADTRLVNLALTPVPVYQSLFRRHKPGTPAGLQGLQYRGVYLSKYGRYEAKFTMYGCQIYLGAFDSFVAAKIAHTQALRHRALPVFITSDLEVHEITDEKEVKVLRDLSIMGDILKHYRVACALRRANGDCTMIAELTSGLSLTDLLTFEFNNRKYIEEAV